MVAHAMKEWAHREGRHPLHALVPAAFRHHLGKARQLLDPHRRRPRHHELLGQGAHPRRAGRVVVSPPAACAPPSRRAATRRGTPPATPSSRTKCCASPRRSAPTPAEALDKKTPLLRSMKAVEEQANRVLALFGEPAPARGAHGGIGAGVLLDLREGLRAPPGPRHVLGARCSVTRRSRGRSWRSITSAPSARP